MKGKNNKLSPLLITGFIIFIIFFNIKNLYAETLFIDREVIGIQHVWYGGGLNKVLDRLLIEDKGLTDINLNDYDTFVLRIHAPLGKKFVVEKDNFFSFLEIKYLAGGGTASNFSKLTLEFENFKGNFPKRNYELAFISDDNGNVLNFQADEEYNSPVEFTAFSYMFIPSINPVNSKRNYTQFVNDLFFMYAYSLDKDPGQFILTSDIKNEECDFPQTAAVNNSQALNLFRGKISEIDYSGSKETKVMLNIINTKSKSSSFEMRSPSTYWTFVQKNYNPSDVLVEQAADADFQLLNKLQVFPPGKDINYILNFCNYGEVKFIFNPGFNFNTDSSNYAPFLTLLSVILGTDNTIKFIESSLGTKENLENFLSRLINRAYVDSALNHTGKALKLAVNKDKNAYLEMKLASADLKALSLDKEQVEDLLLLFNKNGLNIDLKQLSLRLKQTPAKFSKIYTDLVRQLLIKNKKNQNPFELPSIIINAK